jgi:hypothetical protein
VLGRRVQVQTAEPTQMLVMARKREAIATPVVPQQSDYAGLNWQKSAADLAAEHAGRTSMMGHARQLAISRVLLPGMVLVRNFGGPGFPGLYRREAFVPVDPVTSML